MKRMLAIIVVAAFCGALGYAQKGGSGPAGPGGGSGAGGSGPSAPSSLPGAAEPVDGAKEFSPGYKLAEVRKDLEAARLNAAERAAIKAAFATDAKEEAATVARIRELQQKLARYLLAEDSVNDPIKAVLREGADLEYGLRLIQVKRYLAVKAILGEARWASLYRLAKSAQGREDAMRALASEYVKDPAELRDFMDILGAMA